jgi:pimeloyl-ACP methyl ester carboxylesterase
VEAVMNDFVMKDHTIDGVRVQVLEAGAGEPVVYLHAAGTLGGFRALLPLAHTRRLIIPIHPGFGASEDDPRIDSALDYVVHYSALFDALGLDNPVDLVGHSLGGWIASLFTIFNRTRVRRLALACPAGLRVPEYPTVDLFKISPDKIAFYMFAVPPQAPAPLLPEGVPVSEMMIARYREMTSLARFMWERNYEPKLERWLKHISVPVLLLWGEQDRVIPVQQAQHWASRLGGSTEIATFGDAGHVLWHEASAAVGRMARFFQSG